MLWALCSAPAFLVQVLSFGYIKTVIRPPSLRNKDAFEDGRLCERCQQVLRRSSIISGSWLLLVKSCERFELYETAEAMQFPWRNCPLCEALLSQKVEDSRLSRAIEIRGAQGYGTMRLVATSRTLIGMEQQRVFLNVKHLNRFGIPIFAAISHEFPTIALTLDTSDGVPFRSLNLFEGRYKKPAPDVHVSTGSDTTLSMISGWIKDCATHHKDCKLPDKAAPFIPSRLLFVGTRHRPMLKLVFFTEIPGPPYPTYTALSHCWGGHIACRLLVENLDQRLQSIPEETLPKNFSDGINITRRLGISYIWIDSLCIIQDSEGGMDWQQESPTMGKVFAHAHCVIAATSSENSNGGCSRDRLVPLTERNLMASKSWRYFIPTSAPPVRTLFETRVDTAPLARRAWAFQERLLARRVIHFCSDVVLFECNTMQRSEFDEEGARYEEELYLVKNGKLSVWLGDAIVNRLIKFQGGKFKSKRARRGIRGALDVLQRLGPVWQNADRLMEQIEFCQRWFDIVGIYSKGALTVPTDKLVALSGVAELVEGHAQAPYLAGLWNYGPLELQLLWAIREPGVRKEQWCAPSWSWASSIGRVRPIWPRIDSTKLNNVSILFKAKVDHADVFWKGQSVDRVNSQIDAGMLTITGPTIKVYLRPSRCRKNTREVYLSFMGESEERGLRYGWMDKMKLKCARDWDFCSESDWALQSSFIVLHVLTIKMTEGDERSYGLLLREMADKVYERVGAFWSERLPTPRFLDHDREWKVEQVVIQ
ncbi:HET-domain-containing protein [Podospora fimiseda]|uniref:HET-domain-containing protein n=1 Tax=Podospora fimiseda TaxID=252190 RepID=A0AAN6YTD9_9PEZI|nr:HET-domain-containing protein [Podospora fimiseda]